MSTEIKRYRVWDRSTRIFHWINAITVIALMALGTMIINADAFTFESEVFIKKVHTAFGYVFVINLLWRLIWGFIGGHYARWRQVLPTGIAEIKSYLASVKAGKPKQYLGHNPLARLIITAFFLLLTVQGITGLVIAGTDLYAPPFGSYFANWVTDGDPARLAALKPGDRSQVVDSSFKEMRAFRGSFTEVHETVFYILSALVLLHLIGVIVSEIRERNGLVSAMITGVKVLDEPPADGTRQD